MADTKITALTAIGANPIIPSTFPIPMVDLTDTSMAASGTTKKVTVNQILGAGGTATLASASITGDLTVDTSTLKVDSANNRVGIGTASPAAPLDVQGSSLRLQVQASSNGAYATWKYIGKNSTGTAVNFEQGLNITADNAFELYDNQNTQLVSRYVSGASGAHSWFLTGTTAMTLNSTGLGVGASPAEKLTVRGAVSGSQATFSGTASRGLLISTRSDGLADDRTVILNAQYATGSLGQLVIQTAGTDRLLVDASGNVGVGGSPSAKLHVVGGNIRINDGYQLEFGGTTNAIAGSNATNTMNIYTNNVLRVSAKANGQIRFIPLSSDPSGAEAGDVYYNSTSNKLKCYNGTTWNDLF